MVQDFLDVKYSTVPYVRLLNEVLSISFYSKWTRLLGHTVEKTLSSPNHGSFINLFGIICLIRIHCASAIIHRERTNLFNFRFVSLLTKALQILKKYIFRFKSAQCLLINHLGKKPCSQ